MRLETFATLVPTERKLQAKLRIHNPSNGYEIFSRMNCSWENDWYGDHHGITLMPHDCTRNFRETIILPPGHSYKEEFWPLSVENVALEKVKFRFGMARQWSNFTSQELERVYRTQDTNNFFSSSAREARYRQENV